MRLCTADKSENETERYGRYEWGIPTALPRTAVSTCIHTHTHTHFLSLSYTHLLTHPDHQYARLTDALRPRVIEDAPFDSRSRPAVL